MSMLGPGTLGRMHRAMMGTTGGGATMPQHMTMMKIMFAIMDEKPTTSAARIVARRRSAQAGASLFDNIVRAGEKSRWNG
jgi:hypothetical protein